MGYDVKGRCPMLRGGRCSIYEDRPLTCRTYDCRLFAAARIDADRPAITRRARTWVFDLASDDDRRELAAVRAAAAFLRDHPECFVGGPRADNPAHVALAAVRVYDAFLKPDALPPESLLCDFVRGRLAETHDQSAAASAGLRPSEKGCDHGEVRP
jgi:hypothetical protein